MTQWLLTHKVWLLNTRKVHLGHFFKKVDIVRFNSKPSIYNEENEVISDENISDAILQFWSKICQQHENNIIDKWNPEANEY